MRKSKATIVFDALQAGIPCWIGELGYQLDENYELCVVGKKVSRPWNWDTAEVVLLKTDYTVAEFIGLCERASDEDIAVIAMNAGLSQINQGDDAS